MLEYLVQVYIEQGIFGGLLNRILNVIGVTVQSILRGHGCLDRNLWVYRETGGILQLH